MATLSASQAPFIAADGDDIQLGVQGITYSLGNTDVFVVVSLRDFFWCGSVEI
jgi:hypothetical protein